jgi:CheY-like chemotaxis protein
MEASHGQEGLALCELREGRIDLLLTDVVMPERCGRELGEGAVQLRPDLGVVYMSGYARNMRLALSEENETALLQKPFTPIELLRKVRETLDARRERTGGAGDP